jgi:hypothetical protein
MAKTYLDVVSNGRIVSGGGEVTRDRYSGAVDALDIWKAGQLLKLTSGLLVPVIRAGSAVELDTDDLANGSVVFLALEEQTAAKALAGGKCAVQRILPSTILEAVLTTGASTTAPATVPDSIRGTAYQMWQDATGNWAVEQNDTAKPLATVVEVEGNWNPVKDPRADLDSNSEQYNRVRVKLASVSAA